MRLRALTISAIACLLTFAPLAPAQQSPSTEEILSLLEMVRALCGEGNQAAALDLINRVYATMPFAKSPEDRQHLLYSVALTEADMGQFAEAARIAEPMSPGRGGTAL